MIGSQSTGLPATWLPDGAVDEIFRSLPTDAVTIHDNWEAVGLKGTGSCDVSVDDVFVPESFSWGFQDPPRRGGHLYLLGLPGYVAYEHTALALGVGRRALNLLCDEASGKARGFDGSVLGDRPAFQRDLGRMDMKLNAVRAMVFEVFEHVCRGLEPGHPPRPAQQAEMRSAATLATDMALEVVTSAFRYGGGEAVYGSNDLQRCWRDLNTAAQHFRVSESSHENHGRFLLDAKPFG